VDPGFTRSLDDLLASVSRLRPGQVVVLGLPSDRGSSFLRGPARAPGCILSALFSPATNLCAENGLDLRGDPRWVSLGCLELPDDERCQSYIETAVTGMLERQARVLALGGDHAITYPLVKAHAGTYPAMNLLHLDAHPDLYNELDGSRTSHACPMARIMESGLVKRLVQVGIRTSNPHQRRQAERFGVETIEMRDWAKCLDLELDGPVYLSLDLDVLDPAFAPGVSHHEPGGCSTRDVLRLIQGLKAPLVGADIVELNPDRDAAGITAAAAAKLLKEILARMLAL
jgi:agmatinase